MKATLMPCKLKGTINAIESKSIAHRLLICAALTEGITKVRCPHSSEDIDATINCLKAMGSNITRIGKYYIVPKVTKHGGLSVELDCGESGTTLRLMMCVAAGLGLCARFRGSKRLFSRPLEPLIDVLTAHGVVISRDEENRIIQSGKAFGYDYTITGSVSSQFITGLLLMLPLCGGGKVTVVDDFESKPYVDLTVSALRQSDIIVEEEGRTYTVRGRYDLRDCFVEGDWSNAAFFICAAALQNDLTIKGLDMDSKQGDRAVTSVLESFGAQITEKDGGISVKAQTLNATVIDASDIPDLVPILAVVAAGAQGVTQIKGAKRLRLKESDRLVTVADLINNLGGKAQITDDGLIIAGSGKLTGGEVDACRDHRIAMSAAIAATICENPVVIRDAASVSKSYPDFFTDIVSLGAQVSLED